MRIISSSSKCFILLASPFLTPLLCIVIVKDLTWTVLAAEDGGGGGTYPAEVEAPEVVPDPVPEDPEVAATGPFSFSSFSTRCSSAKICSFWMICSWRVAPALSCFFNTATKMINIKTMKRNIY